MQLGTISPVIFLTTVFLPQGQVDAAGIQGVKSTVQLEGGGVKGVGGVLGNIFEYQMIPATTLGTI